MALNFDLNRWLPGWVTEAANAEELYQRQLAEAQMLLRDVSIDLQDRDAKERRGADSARLTAGLRRRGGAARRAAARRSLPRRKVAAAAELLEKMDEETLPTLAAAHGSQLCALSPRRGARTARSHPALPREVNEAVRRRDLLLRLRAELEMLTLRLSGAELGADRRARSRRVGGASPSHAPLRTGPS